MFSFLNPILVMILLGTILFIYAFVSKRKHLLATLLSLEGVMLMLFMMVAYMSMFKSFYSFTLVFLTIVACEGALGLSILVLIVRNYGSDYFKSLNSLMC